ncbi:MAG: metallophosphoesterase [Erysipelotrichaceae bacterium]|nr:metallophosphoesterase [Erysipelotrichaceae bacterium]MDY5251495.1 metallophosphoesterase [Erysipelotrichaceae bacterium]
MTKFGEFVVSPKFVPLFFLLLFLMIYLNYYCFALICAMFGWKLSWLMIAIMAIIPMLYVMLAKQKSYGKVRKVFGKIFGYYFSLFICFSICFAAWFLIRMIVNILFLDTMYDEGLIVAGIAALILYGFGFMKTKQIKKVLYEVAIPGSVNNYRIALLSDLHLGQFVKVEHLYKLVDMINANHVDLVVIAGDIFNDGFVEECDDLADVCAAFRKIKANDGIVAVGGNHDPNSDEISFRNFLSQAGITLLSDDSVMIKQMRFIGRKAYTTRRVDQRKCLHDLMMPSGAKVNIIIDHDPIGIDEAIQAQAELILCGHTHRGQFFPMNIIVGHAYKKGHFWGKHKLSNTWAIVSAGAGFFQLPMRIGSENECIFIDLKDQA